MNEMIVVAISIVVAILVGGVIVHLSLIRQKKAVMDEVERLSVRLREMEIKVEPKQPHHPVSEESSDVPGGEGDGAAASTKGTGVEQATETPPPDRENLRLELMNDKELFDLLSKIIREEEMFRWPDLNRNAVKEHFSLSIVRIGNAFVRGGGTSLPEFVRNCRLEFACRLMVEKPGIPFTEVSYQAGYRRITTFYHDFKARFGMPPAQYREQKLRKSPPNK